MFEPIFNPADAIDVDYTPVDEFDEPVPAKAEDLIKSFDDDVDFDKIYKDSVRNRKATKPKNPTKKQKKTHTKLAKQSRRRNRH